MSSEVALLLLIDEAVEPWLPTLRSIALQESKYLIVASVPSESELEELQRKSPVDLTGYLGVPPNSAIDRLAKSVDGHLVVVSAPVVLPPSFVSPAFELAETDMRCASVSFLSNASGYLSFPNRHQPMTHQILDKDETSITRALRSADPPIAQSPIPYATGAAVLLTRQGLSLVGAFPVHGPADFQLALAEYSCIANARGMVGYLDATTFVTRPRDVVNQFNGESWLLPEQTGWLEQRYPALTTAPFKNSEYEAAFEQAMREARSSVFGLRVLIDGTMLYSKETGTQVTVVALIKALIENDDIAYLGVALQGGIPSYARHLLLDEPKVDARIITNGDLSVFPAVDIVHRPFQVDPGVNMSSWRDVGSRTVMTVLDLIAFQVPGYQESASDWFKYRSTLRAAIHEVDAVVAISEEVQKQIELERLPIERERLFTVMCGVDHITGNEDAVMPQELIRRKFDAQQFLLVLGTNYTHKNRDLAIRTLSELRKRGYDLHLVLAGAYVPYGSSRIAEAAVVDTERFTWTIPDVSTTERNWLLRHAEVVLYPTAAEGFGLIPNEAASFGTPTVFVPFGPLSERFSDLPVSASDWSVEAFADATERLLEDPAIAKAQTAAVAQDTERYDWRDTAEKVVRIYRTLLSQPPRQIQPAIKNDREP